MRERALDSTNNRPPSGGGAPVSRPAPEYFELSYGWLRAIAARQLRNERRGHTLQATALVHEAFMRLGNDARFADRAEFLAAAAVAMRRVLVDHARRTNAAKRVNGRCRVALLDEVRLTSKPTVDALALDDALTALSALSPRQGRVVELRFFAGMGIEEIASTLGVSPRTVTGDWRVARTWLRRALGDPSGSKGRKA